MIKSPPRNLLRVGLVGAGAVAQVAHLPALSKHPGVTIAGVVTSPPEQAAEQLSRWPIEAAYNTVDEMLERASLGALFVLTPKHAHGTFIRRGLAAGLDVFTEKPLASTVEEARGLADLARGTDRILMVGFNRRYAEIYRVAHDAASGFESLVCVAQKNRSETGYRNTLENAIHMVDLIRWFCGDPDQVAAQAIKRDPYREAGATAILRSPNDRVGILVASYAAGEWDERLELYGGTTSIRVIAPDSVVINKAGDSRLIENRPRAYGWAEINETFGFGPEVRHFVDCVANRTQPMTTADEAVRTQELLDRILQAAGLPVEDSPDSPKDHGQAQPSISR